MPSCLERGGLTVPTGDRPRFPANPSRMLGQVGLYWLPGQQPDEDPGVDITQAQVWVSNQLHTRLLCRSISLAASSIRSGSSDRELNSWRQAFMKAVMSTAAASISASGRSNFSEACLRNLSREASNKANLGSAGGTSITSADVPRRKLSRRPEGHSGGPLNSYPHPPVQLVGHGKTRP